MAQLIPEPPTNAMHKSTSPNNAATTTSPKRKLPHTTAHQYSHPSKKTKGQPQPFPRPTIQLLNSWLASHLENPFPTPQERMELMARTGLNKRQLGDWLNKARRKIKGIRPEERSVTCVLGGVSACVFSGVGAAEVAIDEDGTDGMSAAARLSVSPEKVGEEAVEGAERMSETEKTCVVHVEDLEAVKEVVKDQAIEKIAVQKEKLEVMSVADTAQSKDVSMIDSRSTTKQPNYLEAVTMESVAKDASAEEVKIVDSSSAVKQASLEAVPKENQEIKTIDSNSAVKQASLEATRVVHKAKNVVKKTNASHTVRKVSMDPAQEPEKKNGSFDMKEESSILTPTGIGGEHVRTSFGLWYPVGYTPKVTPKVSYPKPVSKETGAKPEPKKSSAYAVLKETGATKVVDESSIKPTKAAPALKAEFAPTQPKTPGLPKIVDESSIRPPQKTPQTLPAPESTPETVPTSTEQERAAKSDTETATETNTVPAPTEPEIPHVPTVGLSDSVKEYLHKWLMAHVDNPFPTKEEKNTIIADLGLHPVHDSRKIDGWFSRQRRKLRDAKKVQPSSDPCKDSATAEANKVTQKGWAPPSCTEVDTYLYHWMSREENLGDYAPNHMTRTDMEAESGIESRRIESWFYRLRKRMKKQADNEGVELETLQKVMTEMLVKERMKREGLLPESDVEDLPENDPEEEPEEETNSQAESATSEEEVVSGLDILADVATYQQKLPPSTNSVAKLLVTGLSNIPISFDLNASVKENGTVVSEESDRASNGFEGSLFSSISPNRPESPSLIDFYKNL